MAIEALAADLRPPEVAERQPLVVRLSALSDRIVTLIEQVESQA